MHQHFGQAAVFTAGALVAAAWLLAASGMTRPGRYTSRLVDIAALRSQVDLVERLRQVPGVVEVVVVADEGVAYLKVDRDLLDDGALDAIVARPA